MSPDEFLSSIERIVRPLGLDVNRTVYTQAPEFPTVACIVDSAGSPVSAVLPQATELSAIRSLQTWLPVTVAATNVDRAKLMSDLQAGSFSPQFAATSPTHWESAFGELRILTHWAADPRCVVCYETMRKRLAAGWDMERAMQTAAPEKRPKPKNGKVLFMHSCRQWSKKIGGKQYYFGPGDYSVAYAKYLAKRQAIDDASPTLKRAMNCKDLANRFLNAKEDEQARGQIGRRALKDYVDVLGTVLRVIGTTTLASELSPDLFGKLHRVLADGVSARTCGNRVRLVVAWINWVNASGLLPNEIRTGPDFRPPSLMTLRRQDASSRREHGLLMFEPDEIRILLAGTKSAAMRAMILLGLNCGMGNTDCAEMQLSAVDIDTGWLDYPRPKTLIPRRAELWPETLAALQEAIALRSNPADPADEDAVFLTRRGARWVHQERHDDAISKEFSKILRAADLKRYGLSFYSLRRTFQTIADEFGDDAATKRVMGHADSSMSAVYRQRFPDERLRALSEFVRGRLQPIICTQQELDEIATRKKKPGYF